jgi:hypothetical protein
LNQTLVEFALFTGTGLDSLIFFKQIQITGLIYISISVWDYIYFRVHWAVERSLGERISSELFSLFSGKLDDLTSENVSKKIDNSYKLFQNN